MKFYFSDGSFAPLYINLLSIEYHNMIHELNNKHDYRNEKNPSFQGSSAMFSTYYISTDKNNRLYAFKDYIRFDVPIITVKPGLVNNLDKYCRHHRSLKVLRKLSSSSLMMVKSHQSTISYFHPIKYMPIKLGDIRVREFKSLKIKKRS